MREIPWILVRGAGDLATGVLHKLRGAGFPVLALETGKPLAIRRQVAFSEAVYDGSATVEGIRAVLAEDPAAAEGIMAAGEIPVLVDPAGESIPVLRPAVVVDAILAKRNLGTRMDLAPLTVALGPGFTAGVDVHFVIETCRGHDLGRIISRGAALPDTGTPGLIAGYGAERVVHAPAGGTLRARRSIGDRVAAGEALADIVGRDGGRTPAVSALDGLLRGLIRDGAQVTKGLKIADVDPRAAEYDNCFKISDKARCVAGGVLEVVCREFWKRAW